MSDKDGRLKYRADPNKMYIALKVGWGDSVDEVINFSDGFIKRDGKGGLEYFDGDYMESLSINDVVMKNVVTNKVEVVKGDN